MKHGAMGGNGGMGRKAAMGGTLPPLLLLPTPPLPPVHVPPRPPTRPLQT
jgi:hypothetical protein